MRYPLTVLLFVALSFGKTFNIDKLAESKGISTLDAVAIATNYAKTNQELVEIVFEPHVYEFPEQTDRWCCIELEDIEGLSIDGNGATFILHPNNNLIYLSLCKYIEIKNITIDYSPLPFTQGRVVGIDADNGTLIGKIADGHVIPNSKSLLGHCALLENTTFTHNWFYIDSLRNLPENTIAINAKPEHFSKLKAISEGENFTFAVSNIPDSEKKKRFRMKTIPNGKKQYSSTPFGVIQANCCEVIKFDNITHFISPSMTYRLTGCFDVSLSKVKIIRKPQSDSLPASLSGGMHIIDCDLIKITNCHFEALLDDSINISAVSHDAVSQQSPVKFIVSYGDIQWYDTPIDSGDTVLVFDPETATIVDEVVVSNVEFVENQKRILTLQRPVENIDIHKISDPELMPKFFIKSKYISVINNCSFNSQLKTAILIRTPAEIKNCSFWQTAMGVHSFNSFKFGEGPIPAGLTIRDNKFAEILFSPISITRLGKGELLPAGGPICIDSNEIKMKYKNGISVNNMSNVKILRNVIYKPERYSEFCQPVSMSNCDNITLVPINKGYFDMDQTY